jgi:hypothetical protein
VIEVTLICDSCATVLGTGTTGGKARRACKHLYRRIAGKDLCTACCDRHGYRRPGVHARRRPESPL